MKITLVQFSVLLSTLLISSASFAGGNFKCGDLSGKTYLGPEGQGGEPMPGCEGCGNDGSIGFEDRTLLTYISAGNDIMEACTYAPAGKRTLIMKCEYDETSTTLNFSKDCKTISADGGIFHLYEGVRSN